jgi:hypothetical protein
MYERKKIAIIGAGGIGSRHLQALSKLAVPAEIFVIDPSGASLDNAAALLDEVSGRTVSSIEFKRDLTNLDGHIDLAVISTNSDVRRLAFEELLAKAEVGNILFEKVLFQKVEDYYAVRDMIDDREIRAYVNCARRYFDVYTRAKEMFEGDEAIELEFTAADWGLGCNSIHFMDMLAFVSGYFDGVGRVSSGVDSHGDGSSGNEIGSFHANASAIVESKRKGIIDLYGSIRGEIGANRFLLKSLGQLVPEPFTELRAGDKKLSVYEECGRAVLAVDGKDVEEIEFTVPYVSGLTNLIAEEIFATGACRLPTYDESMSLHIPMIKAFLSAISELTGEPTYICNIS